MIDDLLKIGDEVVITIPKESRGWGYNPCPDSTRAMVLGFSESHYGRVGNFGHKPGVYVNRAWVKVLLPNGTEYSEYSGRLELSDEHEHERRLREFRALQKAQPDNWRSEEFLRELPETPFWEDDIVRVNGHSALMVVHRQMPPDQEPGVFQVVGIQYHQLTEHTQAGTMYPAYSISSGLGAGWYTSASEDCLVLVERGPVWKFYHAEPIVFDNIEEEANFFIRLGHTREVRNPANGLYSWSKEEVLKAIRSGIVHGFRMSKGLFGIGTGSKISAIRFNNEELGKRVARATLEGFGMALA